MSKILVTGAYGFIGANFLKFLLESTEHEVINVDSCTYAANLTYLADLRKQHRGKRYHYQYGDISQFKDICSIIFYTKPDIIINFAAQTHVDNSIAAPIPFVSTNITGTFNLLECARLLPVQKFIQVSTDEVYGMLVGEYQPPFKETDILKPSSVYSASKAAADLLALSYYKTYKLPICVTRCCNNFGINQHKEKLIPKVISNALQNIKIPVYGTGENIREWINVEDHCSAIEFVLARGIPGEVYNVGSGFYLKNIEIVKVILDLLGKSHTLIEFVPDRPGHDLIYRVDWSKIQTDLQWNPQKSNIKYLLEVVKNYASLV